MQRSSRRCHFSGGGAVRGQFIYRGAREQAHGLAQAWFDRHLKACNEG